MRGNLCCRWANGSLPALRSPDVQSRCIIEAGSHWWDEKMNDWISFFDKHFQRQIVRQDFTRNPFKIKALSHIKGRVLDVGCGLGNLSIAAARNGNPVVAVDASAAAIASLTQRVRSQNLPVAAYESNAQSFAWEGCFDTVVSIGLLMFLPCDVARDMVQRLRQATCPHGTMIVNILVK